MLKIDTKVPRGEALVSKELGPYIAVRTPAGILPHIPWRVFRSNYCEDVPQGMVLVSTVVGVIHQIPIVVTEVNPLNLSHIIITATKLAFEKLHLMKSEVKLHLPHVVCQGDYLTELDCRVKACEPVDQGIFDPDHTVISVVCESLRAHTSHGVNDSIDLEISNFLNPTPSVSSELLAKPISQRLVPECFRNGLNFDDDLENAGFLRVDKLASLGCFSGDYVLVQAQSSTRCRFIQLFSYPEPNTIDTCIYLPPLLLYNLGSPTKLLVQKLDTPIILPVAEKITISRIASEITTNRKYERACLSGLKSYFEIKKRVIKEGDTIAIPIDTLSAEALPALSKQVDNNELVLADRNNAVAWFSVDQLVGGDQCIIDTENTNMVQSGLCQRECLPSSLGWHNYFGIDPPVSYFESTIEDVFTYARRVLQLLSLFKSRKQAFQMSLLLSSSKRGVGKASVLSAAAAYLGLHEMVIDCYSITGDTDTKTLGFLRARLERAATIDNCLVTLRHLDFLAGRRESDGRDSTLVNGLVDALNDLLPRSRIILAATANDADQVVDSVRSKFKFEIEVNVPNEKERVKIFENLTQKKLSSSQLTTQYNEVLDGFAIRADVSLQSLAILSAGLAPIDLKAIIKSAKQTAFLRNANDRDSIICQQGLVKITNEDLTRAINDARDNYSDSIGAPKIPNVGWNDVGGLETVKSEILDTIELPLKKPHLFTSGIKTRSGILFYGPPGTGKTLLAKAIASNFSLNFFSVKGPELLNMYIGESEANVRRVFQKARDAKPCVIFFDELDSVAPKRGNQGDSGGVMDRIVSQLLAELDSMNEGSEGVFVIGATNRPDLLDEALLRPGRFDKLLYLGVADTHEKQRRILEALTRRFTIDPSVDLDEVVAKCPTNYTGADFYALSSDAMLNAMNRKAAEVDAKFASYNKSRIADGESEMSLRAWFQDVADPIDLRVSVTAADFIKAQEELTPSVSAEELAHYQRVRNLFENRKEGQ